MNRIVFVLMLLLAGLWHGGAIAQSCSLSATLNFGTINPLSSVPAQGQSTATFNCTGFATPYVRVCANLGDDQTPREMVGPTSARLHYELYQDATRTTIWGSAWHGNPPLYVDIPLSGGAGTAQKSFYGTVFTGQTNAPAGSYTVTITSTILLGYGYTTTPPVCSTSGQTSWQSFQVSTTAMVASDCTISGTNIDFGQQGFLQSAVTSTGVITATCTKGSAYTLALSAGSGAGATVASRLMTRSGGSDTLAYGLYRDSGRTQVWGDGTGGSGTVSNTGTGTPQTATVYATLPVQPPPRPGSYIDTITVTVTF
ncbi:Csu type fimbrial protein [Lysobacter changpingensis]|uniref:Csu type fimbrial protein n=1 Tax=Lysobacter changpingensis TaxID=2792784 RepID=UPI001A8F77D1|nr:spore coat protein U domain-containing protein [Lysobacter changpingensis]